MHIQSGQTVPLTALDIAEVRKYYFLWPVFYPNAVVTHLHLHTKVRKLMGK